MAERTVKGQKARMKPVPTVHVRKLLTELVMQVLQIEFLFCTCSHDNNYCDKLCTCYVHIKYYNIYVCPIYY